MSAFDMHRSPRCQHVHYNGKACKAPARRGRNYCVFHQAAHFDSGGCVLPIIEDIHSYQLAIIRIARALAEDAIEPKKATALLYALQLAGWKLKDFTSERTNIEDPGKAVAGKLLTRFIVKRAKFPVPTDKEMDELLNEVKLDRSYEPNENVALFPDPLDVDDEEEDDDQNEGSPEGTDAGSPARSAGKAGEEDVPSPVGTSRRPVVPVRPSGTSYDHDSTQPRTAS
jgi:hypothetical protein